MSVELAVTRTCHHCRILEEELQKLGVSYSVRYIEEDTDFQKKYKIMGSPNILVDGELVFRGMPAIHDLKEYFERKA